MKLLIQIPCLNEEATLPLTLNALPKSIPGISRIEVQVINDGSTDRTEAIAKEWGVDHIISFKRRRGLARAFEAGMRHAIHCEADILVNTDADAQYRGESIADLVRPIVEGKADIVVGARDIDGHAEFSWLKKKLQHLGSSVLRLVSETDVIDAASGFRAYSRYAISRLHIFSHFSYTMETLIQAGHQNFKVVSVPIEVNPKTRESRLFKNIFHYIWKSGGTIVNVFLIYRSKVTFSSLSLGCLATALTLVGRYCWLVLHEGAPRTAFWPSIILASCLFVMSIQFYIHGIQAMLTSANRKLLEEIVLQLRDPSRPKVSTSETAPSPRRSSLSFPSAEHAA